MHQRQEKAKPDHTFGTPSKRTIQADGLWDCQERLGLWFYLLSGAVTLRTKNTGLSGDHTLHGQNSVAPESMPFGGDVGNRVQPLGARYWSGSGVWW